MTIYQSVHQMQIYYDGALYKYISIYFLTGGFATYLPPVESQSIIFNSNVYVALCL